MEQDLGFLYFFVWCAIIVILGLDARVRGSCGLTLVYSAFLTMLHLPGGALLMVPWYEYYPKSWTLVGFEVTLTGFIAFAVGAMCMGFLSKNTKLLDNKNAEVTPKNINSIRKISISLIIISLITQAAGSYSSTIRSIPTIGAVISSFDFVGAPGICLYIHSYIMEGKKIPLHALFFALVFPIFTTIFLGFLGFGFNFVVFVICFSVSQSYFPKRLFLAMPFIIYASLTLFVNYMEVRNDLRDAVAGKSISERFDVVADASSEFEWFDSSNFFHLRRLDDRLNQNWLVGAAVINLRSGRTAYMNGESLYFAAIAWIPRAIWADKPQIAGSGDIAANLTGQSFADQTSVGVGPTLEFFANVGQYGMILSMFIIGVLLRWIDLQAIQRLRRGQVLSWCQWILPGFSLLEVGGQLAQIPASFIGLCIAGFIISSVGRRLSKESL